MTGDCCVDVEQLIDVIMDLLRLRFNAEREDACGFATKALDAINDYDIYFGKPQVVRGHMALAVWCNTETPGGGDEGLRSLTPSAGAYSNACPIDSRAEFVVACYHQEYDHEDMARKLSRMLTVVKRVLLRNPWLILSDKAYASGIESMRVSHHERVQLAFNNRRAAKVWFAAGTVTFTVRTTEKYTGVTSP